LVFYDQIFLPNDIGKQNIVFTDLLKI